MPHSSPISKASGTCWHTLFENASCHIALGQCYAKCFVDGDKLTPELRIAAQGNKSLHPYRLDDRLDKIDIDGIRADGSRVPVFARRRA